MSTLPLVIFFSLIGGIFSLAGGIILITKKSRANKLAYYATPFAAGALLAAAFIDILPEANHEGSIDTALFATLGGIIMFFLLERFLRWFHHNHEQEDHQKDPTVPLIITGDTLHNFIDGIAIAAAFLVSIPTGIIITFAVAMHEVPHKIGDIGLLLNKGMRRKKVVLVNIYSSLATTIAACIFFILGQSVKIPLDAFLGITAGFFIYIAVSDIIPSIHKQEKQSLIEIQTILLLLGVVIVGTFTKILDNLIK